MPNSFATEAMVPSEAVYKLIQGKNTEWDKPLFVVLSITILIMTAVVMLIIQK